MGTLRYIWLLAALVCPFTSAWATPITITFDQGAYDPDPAPCDYHGPYDYLESGVRVSGGWLQDYGTVDAEVRCGHTHLGSTNYPGADGNAIFDHPWDHAVQGIIISLLDGGTFDVISIDTRVRYRWGDDHEDSEHPNDWSFPDEEVHMMVSSTFDPTHSMNDSLAEIESYFTAISIDDGSIHYSGGDPRPHRPDNSTPFITNQILNEHGITTLWIMSSGSTAFDNIVIDPNPIPEPGTAMLVGLGILGLATRNRPLL